MGGPIGAVVALCAVIFEKRSSGFKGRFADTFGGLFVQAGGEALDFTNHFIQLRPDFFVFVFLM